MFYRLFSVLEFYEIDNSIDLFRNKHKKRGKLEDNLTIVLIYLSLTTEAFSVNILVIVVLLFVAIYFVNFLCTLIKHLKNKKKLIYCCHNASRNLWGAEPVNIPYIFIWSVGLFIWSTRLFLWSTSLFICSTRLFIWPTNHFLYGQLDLLYGQLDFFYGQLITFYMVNSTFYMVNESLFIWSTRPFIWSTRLFLWSTNHFLYGQLDLFYGNLILFIYGQLFNF